MSSGSQSGLEQAERLCEVLERIARALVELDNEALLGAESTLAELVSSFQAMAPCTAVDRAAVEAVVQRGRAALMRCRRLGASFTGIARARLSTCATVDTYNSVGAVADPSGPSPTVRATI
jgi:hypothetical protein